MGTELKLADSFRLPIIDKLIDTASSYLNPSELEGLRKASPQIQAILSAAEQGHFNEHNLEREALEWLQKLKGAVDEMEFILDEMECRRLERRGMGEAGNKHFPFFFKHTPESEKDPLLEMLRGEVSNLYPVAPPSIPVLRHLRLTVGLTSEQQNQLDRSIAQDPDSFLAAHDLFLPYTVRRKISELLMGSSHGNRDASVVSIVGTNGVWKTILAQCLYKDQRIKESFAKMMWICVSSTFDGALLLRKVIAYISDANSSATPPSDGAPLEELHEYVEKELATKKFLLVLDDVWLDDEWEKFVTPFINSQSGTKILLTTRMDLTTKPIGQVIDIDQESQLWLQNSCYRQNVGPEGYDNNETMKLLMSRYRHLPEKLQKCFRFCSIFGKNYVFHREELIYIWMALGFLQESKYKEGNLVDVGGEYFDTLFKNSLFTETPHSQDANSHFAQTPHSQNAKRTYIMNDLMYDLALFVSGGECGTYYNDNAGRIDPEKIRHLNFVCHPTDTTFSVIPLGNLSLHTLLLQFGQDNNDPKYEVLSESGQQHIFQSVLTNLKRLRVLILSGYRHELPDKIGDLLHLRLLRLKKTDITLWPTSLGKLHHLKVICKDQRRHQ